VSGGGDGDGGGGGPADCRTADVSKPAGLEAVLAKASPESNANFDNIYIYVPRFQKAGLTPGFAAGL
jgi:hypothetical protein